MARTVRPALSIVVALSLVFGLAPAAYAAPATNDAAEGAVVRGIDAQDSPISDGVLIVLSQQNGASLLSDDASNVLPSMAQALDEANLAITDGTKLGNGQVVLTAQPTDGATDAQAADAAERIPGVAYAQPDYVYDLIDGVDDGAESVENAAEDPFSLFAVSLFNDPIALVSKTTDGNGASIPNAYWLYAANLDDAWSEATSDGEVVVATFDSGVMLHHEDLSSNLLADLAWDSYNKAPLDASRFYDGDNGGHGTHVAGIISAVANNGIGVAGASYNAKILPIKVVSDSMSRPTGKTSDLVAAYQYLFDLIDSGQVGNVRVVNMSLGLYRDAGSETVNDKALETAIEQARDAYGIVTVCAGGNGDQYSTPSTDRIIPADFDACVSVTALEEDGTNIPYSDYNEWKDISAPGRNIWSTYIYENSAADGYYGRLSGTSMASPIVAGAFALLFAAVPNATVDEAVRAVLETAAPIIDPDNDRSSVSGSAGAIDADAALGYLVAHHVPTFPDVPDSQWYAEAVAYVAQRGLMSGYDDGPQEGMFAPEEPMTRAMMAQVLYNCYGNGAIAPATSHTDVDQGQWYAEAVNWVVSEQLMTGDDGLTTFRPNDEITREELAIAICNVSTVETIADPEAFDALPDSAATNPWAAEAARWAVGNGVINGVEVDPEGSPGYRILNPQGIATRATVAQVLMNSLKSGIL